MKFPPAEFKIRGHSKTMWTRWGGRRSKNVCFWPRRGVQKMAKFCPRICWKRAKTNSALAEIWNQKTDQFNLFSYFGLMNHSDNKELIKPKLLWIIIYKKKLSHYLDTYIIHFWHWLWRVFLQNLQFGLRQLHGRSTTIIQSGNVRTSSQKQSHNL